ncbi:hypothetical protein ANN_07105 [Periplaneta americana]|uniref:ISXO2-like transposase domain-containing protein n=1 Tax=Periplaneta americana TaxID=6978 RepID=A0ABQ8TFK4_PERAM|nr:hypothetical protein ANN_07105 [Periplaneta americana]
MAFNLRKLCVSCRDIESCIDFCVVHKLLPSKESNKCIDCGAEGKVVWQKRSKNKNVPYCLKCSSCHKESAIAVKTWFERTKLTVAQSLTLIYLWQLHIKIFDAAIEAEVSANTVVDYYRFYREVCYVIITNSQREIGGVGHVVEVDESHLFVRKYNRGRLTKHEKEHIWIFGGIDRDTKQCFALRVNRRNKETLCSLIKNFILPGTKICTDGWKSYKDLEKEGYLHGIVNHSVEFINSEDSRVCTQTVERMWGTLKSEVKRKGRESEHDDLYMFEFLYRQMQRRNGQSEAGAIFLNFLEDIGKVYPGR